MPKIRCPSCNRKVDSKFSFCPHCGVSVRDKARKEDYGMLGKTDSPDNMNNMRLPFGMEKIMGSLIKQIEKQMGSMDFNDVEGMPKGIKIRVARRPSNINPMVDEKPKKLVDENKVSQKEMKRRMGLKRIDAESKVRRLSDSIVYEIDAPGVRHKDDVVLTRLATGLEIKSYSKDKCYVKFIPLSFEVIKYTVKQEKVFIELKD